MKHPVSVVELLELHRLGELYVKWASNPVAMSDEDLVELEKLTEMYSIPGTSALFAFQKQFHNEFGLTAENTVSIHEIAKEVLAIADAKKAMEYQDNLVVKATEQTGYIEPVHEKWNPEAEPPREFEVTHVQDSDGFLKPTGAEMDEALREQLHEDNEIDREEQAAYRADQLRDALADGEKMTSEREIEILREISNVDELTKAESDRLDDLLCRRKVQDSGTHRIPTGVLAEAVGGSEKGSK